MNEKRMPLSAIKTPAVIVYMDVLESNIARMSRLAREAGVRLRPHTKIHECPDIAKMQIAAGACGIEVGAIERALCMAEAGIDDILIAHPFYGDHKLAVLRRLLDKPGLKITVMVDMMEQAEGISRVGESIGRAIPTLLKVNTGGDRFGVPPGEPALRMAKQLCRLTGIAFEGIYVHEMGGKPTPESMNRLALESATMAAETARLLSKEGIPGGHVSVGASPTLQATCSLLKGKQFPEITEIHPGHCAIGDMWHVRGRVSTREACAAAVLCTVMSAADPGHVVGRRRVQDLRGRFAHPVPGHARILPAGKAELRFGAGPRGPLAGTDLRGDGLCAIHGTGCRFRKTAQDRGSPGNHPQQRDSDDQHAGEDLRRPSRHGRAGLRGRRTERGTPAARGDSPLLNRDGRPSIGSGV